MLPFRLSWTLVLFFLGGDRKFCVPHSTVLALQVQTSERLFKSKVYATILEGRIAVLPNFLPRDEIQTLQTDAADLWNQKYFSTDALAGYGSSGKFDPQRDRAVLKLNQWKDTSIGDWEARRRFGSRMAAVRSDLAVQLNRPKLDTGLATTKYGNGSTEISYTRFGPGAFLKRHVDEHHEELKGTAGWVQPTRRSVSWLIYLNQDWDAAKYGGQLRCFERQSTTKPSATYTAVGARPNGDLQIAWLRASAMDPVDRPVFLDGRQRKEHGKCAMYIVQEDGTSLQYITDVFDAHPILYMGAGGDALAQKLLVNRRDLAERFHYIEPPKSKLGDLLATSSSGGGAQYTGMGVPPLSDEVTNNIDPIGGTLVLFDSVSLPHEVLATRDRERWATSGWFHEDQQPALPTSS
jgi:Rps23 Pro-64 3,4-dihydroxylase Tpa1-like proline 4-hydroxylase